MTSVNDASIYGAVLYKNSRVIDTPKYLKTLWNKVVSISPSSEWKIQRVGEEMLHKLSSEYDNIILSAGFGLVHFQSNQKGLSFVRGRCLRYRLKDHMFLDQEGQSLQPLRHAILSGEYVIPTAEGHLIAGATKEKLKGPYDTYDACANESGMPTTSGEQEEEDSWRESLEKKIQKLYPHIRHYDVVDTLSGVRVSPGNTHLGKLPFISKHHSLSNAFIVGGFGARGLLYHIYIGELVSEAIDKKSLDHIPKEILR